MQPSSSAVPWEGAACAQKKSEQKTPTKFECGKVLQASGISCLTEGQAATMKKLWDILAFYRDSQKYLGRETP